MVLLQRKTASSDWYDVKLPEHTHIGISEKGWTDNELGFQWIAQCFEPFTRPRTTGVWRLLVLDGHESHTTWQFINFCHEKKIIPLCLPPHATHLLQPLDVGIFSPLSHYYGLAVDKMIRFGCQAISKSNFLELYMEAHNTTYKPTTILSAFRATGLIPFDPSAVIKNVAVDSQGRPTTPPSVTITDGEGNSIQIPVTPYNIDAINGHIRAILVDSEPAFSSDIKKRIEQLAKSASIATTSNIILKKDNQDLFQANQQKKKPTQTKIPHDGRVLSVEEAAKKKKSREEKEALTKQKRVQAAQMKAARAQKQAERRQHNATGSNESGTLPTDLALSDVETTVVLEPEEDPFQLCLADMAELRQRALEKVREGHEAIDAAQALYKSPDKPQVSASKDQQEMDLSEESGVMTRRRTRRKVEIAKKASAL
jgi:hypothetical protein